jgi:alginate O-acetyltransferase complex protein AlgI
MDLSILIHNLAKLLFYSQKAPIIFNSGQFLLFFSLFLAVYVWVFNKINWRLAWLTLFSLFFYYKSSGSFVLLLAGTAVFNYSVALWLERLLKEEDKKTAKIVFISSVLLNLSSLLYFKYTNFFLKTVFELANEPFTPLNIFLPIGISFFTFQTMSYLIDVYNQRLKACDNLLDFTFYLSFFPQLVAGPIVRASDFIPQIRQKLEFSRVQIGEGLFLILKGFIKKAIIADYVAQYADLVYGNPTGYSGFENWMAMYAYTLQIYCDFSGYSDMAIGLSLILGFKLLDNFRSPYQSLDITEFWRRWHISLSFWLRDYVYIPLGGNRGAGSGAIILTLVFMIISVLITQYWWLIPIHAVLLLAGYLYAKSNDSRAVKLFTYINLLLTMLIGGWWHGADWKFVFWGFMHGMGLIVHKFFSKWVRNYKKLPILTPALSWLLTFHFVAFLWIFFRADSFETASLSIAKMFTDFSWAYAEPFFNVRPMLVLMLLLGFGLHFVTLSEKKRMSDYFAGMPVLGKAILFILAIQISLQLQDANVQPFIYFQF